MKDKEIDFQFRDQVAYSQHIHQIMRLATSSAERMKQQFSSTHKIHRSTRRNSSFEDYNLQAKKKGNWSKAEDVFNDLKVL